MRSWAIHARLAKETFWKLALKILSIITASKIFRRLERPTKSIIFRENFCGASFWNALKLPSLLTQAHTPHHQVSGAEANCSEHLIFLPRSL